MRCSVCAGLRRRRAGEAGRRGGQGARERRAGEESRRGEQERRAGEEGRRGGQERRVGKRARAPQNGPHRLSRRRRGAHAPLRNTCAHRRSALARQGSRAAPGLTPSSRAHAQGPSARGLVMERWQRLLCSLGHNCSNQGRGRSHFSQMALRAAWPPKSQKMSFARRTCNRPMLSPTVGAILDGCSGSRPMKMLFICSSTLCARAAGRVGRLLAWLHAGEHAPSCRRGRRPG